MKNTTIRDVIDIVDKMKPNKVDYSLKVQWLYQLDARVWREVYMRHWGCPFRMPPEYTKETDVDTELLIPEPWGSQVYKHWLEAMIDKEHTELQKYNASIQFFNDSYKEFCGNYTKTHMPVQHRTWRF